MAISERPGDIARVTYQTHLALQEKRDIQQELSRRGLYPILKFKIIYADGGCYSQEYGFSNLLIDDGTCYSSLKREGVNLCVQHKRACAFTITGVDVAAPRIGYTCPLGQGIIFNSWKRPDEHLCEMFDEVHNVQEFQDCVRQYQAKLAQMTGLDQDEIPQPILFFDLRGQFRQEYQLGVPRSGRYVLLKLLRSRNYGENIDVRYVGFRGFYGGFSSPSCAHA
eukprot:TRINITY_DN6670_c0_g1_i2.p1 TRINITY_DN6670_c0_g1~~TRINITY_DN6670_c0_g1_i2.p1  ORF type:complete len:223 (-),score=9.28 TRINITY_DN6670_c0_g1_i2:1478-2146(-)